VVSGLVSFFISTIKLRKILIQTILIVEKDLVILINKEIVSVKVGTRPSTYEEVQEYV
jgi:hypothetical protein